MDIKAVTEWMLAEGYFVCHKEKYKVTSKFYSEVTGVLQGIVQVKGPLQIAHPGPIAWPDRYIQFIKDVDVPRWGVTSDNSQYEMNKYSEAGMRAFKEAMTKHHVVYDLLVKSTKLYYLGKSSFKKAIGNYMSEGLWRTDYDTLAAKAADGEESLHQHLKDSTVVDGTTYQWG